jgi:general secretion pathway protein G
MQIKRQIRKRVVRSGFTLMEVLLVLAILGVLAAMVVPQLIGQQKKASIKATGLSISGLEDALGYYAQDHDGEFPPTGQGLEVLITPQPNDPNWSGPYLKNSKSLPLDAWGQPIQYEYPGQHQVNGQTPDLWSWGPDKVNGTPDDINNWSAGT